jgi:hypothetical protein
VSFLFAVNVGLWLFQSGRPGTDGRKERTDTRKIICSREKQEQKEGYE